MKTCLGNLLLDVLPQAGADLVLKGAEEVELPLGTLLLPRDAPPRYVYFLTSGVASVIFTSERGTSVEVCAEGKEGLIGWLSLFGALTLDAACTMQIAGSGFRVSQKTVQHAFDAHPEVRRRVLEYAQHQTIAAKQVLACNRLHRAEARFSRWLLMLADRIQSPDLPMTQEFMSIMLGTRRTTLAEVSSILARDGAVEGRRGGLRIVNRQALEAHACECYGLLRSRFYALYRAPAESADPDR